jgi:hypothetical protein
VAVRVGVTFAVTAVVVTENVAVVAPWATVTLAGTDAFALLLESVTTAPPAGAAASSVTVAVALPIPPTTLVGLTETAVRFAPSAVRDAKRRKASTQALWRIPNLQNLSARDGAVTYGSFPFLHSIEWLCAALFDPRRNVQRRETSPVIEFV